MTALSNLDAIKSLEKPLTEALMAYQPEASSLPNVKPAYHKVTCVAFAKFIGQGEVRCALFKITQEGSIQYAKIPKRALEALIAANQNSDTQSLKLQLDEIVKLITRVHSVRMMGSFGDPGRKFVFCNEFRKGEKGDYIYESTLAYTVVDYRYLLDEARKDLKTGYTDPERPITTFQHVEDSFAPDVIPGCISWTFF